MSAQPQTSNHIIYVVVRSPFKYDGRHYEKGEIWEPTGGKFDEQIISTGKVRAVDDRVETVHSRTRGISRAEQIVAMKDKQKMTYRAIAKELGIHYSTVGRIYKREKEKAKA